MPLDPLRGAARRRGIGPSDGSAWNSYGHTLAETITGLCTKTEVIRHRGPRRGINDVALEWFVNYRRLFVPTSDVPPVEKEEEPIGNHSHARWHDSHPRVSRLPGVLQCALIER